MPMPVDLWCPACRRPGLLAAAVLAALAGCGSLPDAEIDVPDALQSTSVQRLQGLGGGRQGAFEAQGWRVGFRREEDRWTFFDRIGQDRASATLDATHADGRRVRIDCRALQTQATPGVLQLRLAPWRVQCDARGDLQAELTLTGRRSALGQEQREGQWRRGDATLTLRSLHGWRGSALPSPAPAGYLLERGGMAIGALELNGTAPRAWLPAASSPLPPGTRDDAVLAVAVLAVLWDPAR